MKIFIDFVKREVHFHEDTPLDILASYMNNYFPTDTWGDFKFMIDAGIDENTDIDRKLQLSFRFSKVNTN